MTNDDQGQRPPPEDRLPPPAFPPGTRHRQQDEEPAVPSVPPAATPEAGDFPADAFISPDEVEDEGYGLEEGVATGISGAEPVYPPQMMAADAVDVREAADILERLAHGLRERGPLALLVGPETGRFESVLRGFLAGYLGGLGDDTDIDT